MKKLILLIIAILVIITGCSHNLGIETEQKFVIEDQKQQIQDLQEELDSLKSQIENKSPKLISYTINITKWTPNDIVKALATKENTYKDQKLKEFIYNDDGSFFYYDSDLFPVDPFYKLSYKKRAYEIRPGHLRIYDLTEAYSMTTKEAYDEYKEKLGTESVLNPEVECIEETKCNNQIELITCTKEKNTLFVWRKDKYLFTSRNDFGLGFETFKKVFCETQTSSQITGLMFLDIKSKLQKVLK